jgi:hypothetical protein
MDPMPLTEYMSDRRNLAVLLFIPVSLKFLLSVSNDFSDFYLDEVGSSKFWFSTTAGSGGFGLLWTPQSAPSTFLQRHLRLASLAVSSSQAKGFWSTLLCGERSGSKILGLRRCSCLRSFLVYHK